MENGGTLSLPTRKYQTNILAPAVSDGEKRLITMTPGWDVVDESVAREK